MTTRLRFSALWMAILLCLPAIAVGDEKKDDGKPADEPPPKDAPKPEDPKPEPAPAEPEQPKGDEPKEEAPKDEEPKADDPKKDEPSDPAEEPTPEGAPEKDGNGGAKGPPRITNQAKSPVPVPAGMVYLDGGRAWVGSHSEVLSGMLAGRPANHRRVFNYEVPHHAVFLRPYFIAKYETTNAQYLTFLKDHVVTYDTSSGSLANIDEITAHLTHMDADAQKQKKQRVWEQLYFANKDAIWKAFGDRVKDFQVKRGDGTVDEEATARKFRFEPLPRTLKLRFYSLIPPRNWPAMEPTKDELDHPVRYISYNDIERFAEWAGVHIPTEYEWEWAARGPGSPRFPWGDEWVLTAALANWGGKIVDSRYEPTTLPVGTRYGSNPDGSAGKKVPIDGDGRSWCGCHHMVGNVAEWTSSWFHAYRGAKEKMRHSYMGRYVKVIRGGGGGDGEMLVLRPACRNYIGGGPGAPPYPENAFEWAGFRVASYMKSGRDQLDPIIRRAVRANKLKPHQIDMDRFIGAATKNWVEPAAEPVNHVFFLGRAHSIVLVPYKQFLWEEGMQNMRNAWRRPTSYKTVNGLSKKSQSAHPEWVLGVLHTDVPIEPVLVRKVVSEEEEGEKKKKKKRRRRGRAKAPETQEGKCPPGTYVLGIWFGELCLMDSSLEFVCFIPKKKDQKSHFKIAKVKPEDAPATKLAVDALSDWADFEFDMPLGGKGVKTHRLHVSGRFQFEVGSLEAAGVWVQEDPAKEITAEKWKAWLEAEEEARNPKKKKKKKKSEKKTDEKSDDAKADPKKDEKADTQAKK